MHEIDSTYRQFYVADAGLDPDAPEDWTDTHVAERHNTLKYITALCPEGDISARVICCRPNDKIEVPIAPDFVVRTKITIETGKIGIFGWPREVLEEYIVEPGEWEIIFKGYETDSVISEKDYYSVEIIACPTMRLERDAPNVAPHSRAVNCLT